MKVNYTKNEIVKSLEARLKGIKEELEFRKQRKQSYSDWKVNNTQELEGRLEEIENTLSMFNA